MVKEDKLNLDLYQNLKTNQESRKNGKTILIFLQKNSKNGEKSFLGLEPFCAILSIESSIPSGDPYTLSIKYRDLKSRYKRKSGVS